MQKDQAAPICDRIPSPEGETPMVDRLAWLHGEPGSCIDLILLDEDDELDDEDWDDKDNWGDDEEDDDEDWDDDDD